MRIEIHHHHHVAVEGDILALLRRIERKLNTLMATAQDLHDLLEQANTATNEIAADLQRLLTLPEVPESVRQAAADLVTRLQGVAEIVPPADPAPPTP